MDQVTARKLAKAMSQENQPGRIYVALTEDHFYGRWDGPDPTWVVVHLGFPDEPLRKVPDDFVL